MPNIPKSEKRGYHHGDLRASLIAAAETLIAERGPAGFSLSDAAKMAGVSVAAPYRHFKDRAALLKELAKIGSEKLSARIAAAMVTGGFSGMGMAYLAFAREEPAYYAAMFNSGLSVEKSDAENEQASRQKAKIFQLLMDTLTVKFDGDSAKAAPAAFLVAALSHGIASLTKPGMSMLPKGAPSPEYYLDEGVKALVRGLGGKSPNSPGQC